MAKLQWKPGTMLYPVPCVMISSRWEGKDNIFTAAWAGTICTNPAMVSVSIRPERLSYEMIKKSGQFIINVPTRKLARATDFCGVRSGRDVDKFSVLGLEKEEGSLVDVPAIKLSPLQLECELKNIVSLGSHDMFIAMVKGVNVDESLLDKNGKLCLDKADLICYSHGEYRALGDALGTFGYSVKKDKKRKK